MRNPYGYKVGDIFEYQQEERQRWIIEETCLDFWGEETGSFRCRPIPPLLSENIQTCYWHGNQICMWAKIVDKNTGTV